jgi:phage baseplate assembly protein W
MAIKLNITQRPTAIQAAIERGYLYKDIKFDLTPEYLKGSEMYSTRQTKDLAGKIDKESVLNSVKNILTTSPGEKLLNPLFGLDLRDYLFEVVSETKGFFLAQTVLNGLSFQEPRISVDFIEVLADIDEMQYIINIELSIPELKVYQVSLKGVLNIDGYNFV